MKPGSLCVFTCCLLISVIASAQDPREIDRIYFPYRAGYNMLFKGTYLYYDNNQINPVTGRPKLVEDSASMYYHIVKERMENTDTIAYFDVLKDVGDKAGKDDFLSPLVVNEKGMHFWFDTDKKKELKKSLGKNYAEDINDEKVWTIKAPLFTGKKWESYNYDNTAINPYECLTVDTVITTGIGDLHAFGILTTSKLREEKDYVMYMSFTDYYAQGVGKIHIVNDTYVIWKDSEEKQLLSREELTLQKVWWDGK